MKKKFLAIVTAALIGTTAFASVANAASGTIDVISREDGSGTRGAFIELFGIEEKQGDEKVAASHNGDHNIQDLDRGIFSQYDHSRQKHQKDGGIKRRDVEGVGKCRG